MSSSPLGARAWFRCVPLLLLLSLPELVHLVIVFVQGPCMVFLSLLLLALLLLSLHPFHYPALLLVTHLEVLEDLVLLLKLLDHRHLLAHGIHGQPAVLEQCPRKVGVEAHAIPAVLEQVLVVLSNCAEVQVESVAAAGCEEEGLLLV